MLSEKDLATLEDHYQGMQEDMRLEGYDYQKELEQYYKSLGVWEVMRPREETAQERADRMRAWRASLAARARLGACHR